MSRFVSLRGVRDIFALEGKIFDEINTWIKNIFFGFNFEFLEVPIIENSYIFERATGEDSDAVSKEIYKFEDKSGNIIALRPEFTAGVVRFLIENNLTDGPFPRRYISSGALFRYDRPQKGRYRQFYQINCETFGSSNSIFEIQLQLEIVSNILKNLGIDFILKINHLGNEKSRSNYINNLVEFLKKYEDELSDDSKIRLYKNPLRILDSKHEGDIKILKKAQDINEFYLENENDFLNKISSSLEKVEVDPKLVRGLDYYSGFIFEFISQKEGYAICGGGEYNNLITAIDDKKKDNINAFGFAIGLDRIVLEILNNKDKINNQPVVENPMDKKEIKIILLYSKNISKNESKLFNRLVNNTFSNKKDDFKDEFDIDLSEKNIKLESFEIVNLKKGFEKAIKMNADFILIKFEEESNKQTIVIKNLFQKSQKEIGD